MSPSAPAAQTALRRLLESEQHARQRSSDAEAEQLGLGVDAEVRRGDPFEEIAPGPTTAASTSSSWATSADGRPPR